MKTRDEKNAASSVAAVSGARGGQAWQPRGSWTPARALSSLVPGITRKAFEKHGFASACLITDWAQIVGARLAGDTRPLKLKWPRMPEQASVADDTAKGRPGATLVLQVDPAVALDVQYQTTQIIERINAYFGYRAVAELRIQQEPITPLAAAAMPTSGPTSPHGDASTTGPAPGAAADDTGLDAALARLGAHVRSRKPPR